MGEAKYLKNQMKKVCQIDFRQTSSFHILEYGPRISGMTEYFSMEIGLVWRLLNMNMILSVGQGMNSGCLCIRMDEQV